MPIVIPFRLALNGSMSQPSPAPVMPRGVTNAYFFQIFNASSWSLILGTPMLLFLKNLGASGTVLGITVAMLPLFAALQIPAANFVERIGYKNFVVRGWASRSIFILGIAIAAFLPAAFSPHSRIILILVMLACFATARGISICGYMPWITHLVPENLRGQFISRDSTCMFLALTGTMLLSSWWVGVFPSTRAFGVLFLISYLAALGSLVFLRRIPDVQTDKPRENAARPPWMEMLFFPPFFRFVKFSVCFSLFTSALSVIWVPFMKDGLHTSGSLILGLTAYSSIICAGVSLVTGPIADRTGSRPLMAFASALILLSQFGWLLIAAGVLPAHKAIFFLIIPVGSTGYTILGLSSTRLLMGLVPAMGRSHFFAISSVASSLTLGLMPILWGMALDGVSRLIGDGFTLVPGWTWNRFSLFYGLVMAGTLFAQFFRHRLDEPRAMSTEEFLRILFSQSPGRLVSRVLTPFRRPFFTG
jgi:MFS family permease